MRIIMGEYIRLRGIVLPRLVKFVVAEDLGGRA